MIEVLRPCAVGATLYKPGEYNIDDQATIDAIRDAGGFDAPVSPTPTDGTRIVDMNPKEQKDAYAMSGAYYAAKSKASTAKMAPVPYQRVDSAVVAVNNEPVDPPEIPELSDHEGAD